jgi:hypothetical protein
VHTSATCKACQKSDRKIDASFSNHIHLLHLRSVLLYNKMINQRLRSVKEVFSFSVDKFHPHNLKFGNFKLRSQMKCSKRIVFRYFLDFGTFTHKFDKFSNEGRSKRTMDLLELKNKV